MAKNGILLLDADFRKPTQHKIFELQTKIGLSSVLAGEVASSDIELKPQSWWRDRGITLRYGCRATAIDAEARRVMLADDTSLPFAKLVFATGSDEPEVHVDSRATRWDRAPSNTCQPEAAKVEDQG